MTTITLSNGTAIELGSYTPPGRARKRLQTAITEEQHAAGYMMVAEVAALLDCSAKYVYQLHAKGMLGEARKRGRQLYFNIKWVAWYSDNRGV